MSKQRKKLRYPIRLKVVTMIAVLAAILASVGLSYYAIMMRKVNEETYKKVAKDISASVAMTVNVEDVKYIKGIIDPKVEASDTKPIAEESSQEDLDAYYVQFSTIENDETFKKTRAFLTKFVKTNSDFLDCIYLQYAHVDEAHSFVVYLCDTDTSETSCKPGYLDPIHDESKNLIENPKAGIESHIIKTDRYGWLMTAGTPILDGEDVVAYAMADISMLTIRNRQNQSIARLAIYMAVTLLVLGGIGVVWVSLWMIRPLKQLTDVAKSYDSEKPEESHDALQKLNLKANDEITDLAESIKLMEQDGYVRFNELLDTNQQLILSREETKKMEILANQDGLTGVHNKISYNSEVSRINTQIKNGEKVDFAVVMVDLNFLKDTNDSFGHDTGDVALIKLASLVCETFKLSPVYRIGGDEFVVICRGKDYQKVSSLVDEFKNKIGDIARVEDIDPDHISAAIGYAVFNPKQDNEVEDVFRRADNAMYQNKRQLKNPSKK